MGRPAHSAMRAPKVDHIRQTRGAHKSLPFLPVYQHSARYGMEALNPWKCLRPPEYQVSTSSPNYPKRMAHIGHRCSPPIPPMPWSTLPLWSPPCSTYCLALKHPPPQPHPPAVTPRSAAHLSRLSTFQPSTLPRTSAQK